MHRILRSKAGFSFAEILIGMGIMSIFVVASTSISTSISNSKKISDATFQILTVRNELLSLVKSSDSFAYMGLTASPPINCFSTRSTCATTNVWTPLAIISRDAANQPVFRTNPSDANLGFNMSGQSCPNFPSATCPFRYDAEWIAMCSNATSCLTPQFKVRAVLTVHPLAKVRINSDRFAFETALGQFNGTYEKSCTSVGGVFTVGPPQACQVPMSGACPAGPGGTPQFVIGYDSVAKTMKCRPMWQSVFCFSGCVAGQVMRGTDAAGCPVCRNIVLPSPGPLSGPVCGPSNPCPSICQVNPSDPTCPQATVAPFGGDGGGDGGCGGGGDGCGG